MSFGSFFRNLGQRTTDGIVGVTSGTTPIRALDSPRAYRLVALVGVAAVALSGWLIYRNVFIATGLPKIADTQNANTVVASAELEKLKNKDTDGDGISDYNELYAYRTSPYLKDSDGDGIADGTELETGANPNCPQGKVCEGFRLLTSITDAKGNLTPEFLRKSLASAGVPQTALDKTDDASLLRIYQQVIKSQPVTNVNTNIATTNVPLTNSTSPSTTGLTLSQIQNLSSAEIRQLLVQNGIDRATLDAVDDATLKQIFTEAINTSQ